MLLDVSLQVLLFLFGQYIETIRSYKKNGYPKLDRQLKTQIAHRWARSFEAWGYPVEPVMTQMSHHSSHGASNDNVDMAA